MFGFLKKKITEAVEKLTKKVEEEIPDSPPEPKKEALPEPKRDKAEKKEAREEKAKPDHHDKREDHKRHHDEHKPAKKDDAKRHVEHRLPQEEHEPIGHKDHKPKHAEEKTHQRKEEHHTPVAMKQAEVKPEAVELPKEEKAEVKPAEKAKPEEKKGLFSKLFGKKKEEQPVIEEPVSQKESESVHEEKHDAVIEEKKKEPETKEPEKKGFFSSITDAVTKSSISESKFDEIFWDLEVAMLENNVALEVIDKIKGDMKKELVDSKISRRETGQVIMNSLKKSIDELFSDEQIDIIKRAKEKTGSPYVIVFVGVNGAGKTTTIAKIVNLLKKNGLSSVVGAGDTFRAAAIDQLEEHTTKLGVKLIKHDYGADPAAVAFDTIEHAKSKNKDVVLIDTAGRLHSNKNLMQELKKIIKVANPDLKVFVGESITGNDCVEQVKLFNEMVGIDAIVLSKVDIDEKGGAAISVSYVTGKPIIYLGSGQEYDDIEPFSKEKIIANLGF